MHSLLRQYTVSLLKTDWDLFNVCFVWLLLAGFLECRVQVAAYREITFTQEDTDKRTFHFSLNSITLLLS